MPEFSNMCASGKKGWTSWWALNFVVAQSFQLMACAGHSTFSDIQYLPKYQAIYHMTSKYTAMSVMHVFATLAYFWVGIAHFYTGCKMSKKIGLIAGDVFYLIAMAIGSSYTGASDLWQFGVGWGGFGSACVATAYYFMLEDDEDTHKKQDKLSSVLTYFAFVCTWIGFMGYSLWQALWDATNAKGRASLMFDIFATIFLGTAVICQYYNNDMGKKLGAVMGCLSVFLATAIYSSFYTNDSSVTANAFAFQWIATIASAAAVALIFMKK